MASSRYESVPILVVLLLNSNPKTVIDVGVGFGKIGLLIREYLESWKDRVTPDSWNIEVTGVEGYPNYHKDSFQSIIYNKIIYTNALNTEKYLDKKVDLITCTDMIEHLDKEDSLRLIKKFKDSSEHTILSIPTGSGWLRKHYGQNTLEAHLSEWKPQEIEELGFETITHYKIPDGRTMGIFYR